MEQEFLDFDNRNAWNTVYQRIRYESNKFQYTFLDARKDENKYLNRYRDVNPYDHNRVHLKRGTKDYINASIVKVPNANRSYILTQGPLQTTTGHFWLMIWEQKSKGILMLNRVIEKNTVKCHQYWPMSDTAGDNNDLVLNDVGLVVSFLGVKKATNYTERLFLLTDFQSGKSIDVVQFHYTTWPDFGVPESPAEFLSFLFDVRASGVLDDNVGPAVVHCSAGIGRSGTFCLVDSCLVLIEKQGDASSIDVRKLLLEMRHYRMGLIQTPDQLRFSYLAIIEGSTMVLNKDSLTNSVPFNDAKKDSALDNSKTKSDNGSENSDDDANSSAGDDSALLVPPPLPPRPLKNQQDLSSISSYSLSDASLQDEIPLEDSFDKTYQDSDQNQNKPYETLNSETNKSTIELAKSNQKTESKNSLSAIPSSSNDAESAAEIRRRKRKERSENISATVQKIRKQQKDSETWHKRRSFIKRLSVGLVVLFGLSGFIVYGYYSKG